MLGKKYGWLRSLNNTTDTKELKKLATEAMSFGLAEKHYASHALDFIYSITNPNDHKEDNDMGIFTDYFNKLEEQEERLKNQDEQIKNRDEQIKNQDEQIKNQDEQIKDLKKQLKRSDKENSDLKKRLQAIEKKLTNIAVL